MIKEWETDLEPFLADFPSADFPGAMPPCPPEDGRYRLAYWWFGLFENLWKFRGMENAMCDFYEYPDEVKHVFRAVTDLYKRYMERAKEELHVDGVLICDDLGTQVSTFFSPEIFDELFAPFYEELIGHAKGMGLHVLMHSCGCIRPLIPRLARMGLDAIHPIQKYTMDEKQVVAENLGKISFWAGLDVQRTIPWGTPDDVAKEVAFMMDTYVQPDGRFMFTAGNGINGDCPRESLARLLEEVFKQGTEAVKKFR